MIKQRSNPRERRFVDAYLGAARGNATKAARIAGYAGGSEVLKVQGSRLLTRANVRRAIDEHLARDGRAEILKADERDILLSQIARSASVPIHERIRAISELNKCSGRHSVRHLQSGRITLEEALEASRNL
jgi:phage terminase small subunit